MFPLSQATQKVTGDGRDCMTLHVSSQYENEGKAGIPRHEKVTLLAGDSPNTLAQFLDMYPLDDKGGSDPIVRV
jgi:hypothetical protein